MKYYSSTFDLVGHLNKNFETAKQHDAVEAMLFLLNRLRVEFDQVSFSLIPNLRHLNFLAIFLFVEPI